MVTFPLMSLTEPSGFVVVVPTLVKSTRAVSPLALVARSVWMIVTLALGAVTTAISAQSAFPLP